MEKENQSVLQFCNVQPVNCYNDGGTGSKKDCFVYAPNKLDQDSYMAGMVYSEKKNVVQDFPSLKGSNDYQELFADPVEWIQHWNTTGTGSSEDGSIWIPVAPIGYVSLGAVAVWQSNDIKEGPICLEKNELQFKCVLESCCEISKFENTIWTDAGSHGKFNATLKSIYGSPYFGCEGMKPWKLKEFKKYEQSTIFQNTTGQEEYTQEFCQNQGENTYYCLYKNWLYKCFATNNSFKYEDVGPKTGWSQTQGVVKISDVHAIIIYDKACYKINLFDGSWQKLKDENWKLASSHLAGVEYNGNVISVGKEGIYEVCSQEGTWKEIQKEKWPKSSAMCRIGDVAYVATSNGMYQLDLYNYANGLKSTQINEENWSSAKAMVTWNENLYIFCRTGVYIMNQQGMYKDIRKGKPQNWRDLKGAVNFGSNCYVHFPDSVYYVDLHDISNSWKKINGQCWKGTVGMFK